MQDMKSRQGFHETNQAGTSVSVAHLSLAGIGCAAGDGLNAFGGER
jgi:hypothetical protein